MQTERWYEWCGEYKHLTKGKIYVFEINRDYPDGFMTYTNDDERVVHSKAKSNVWMAVSRHDFLKQEDEAKRTAPEPDSSIPPAPLPPDIKFFKRVKVDTKHTTLDKIYKMEQLEYDPHGDKYKFKDDKDVEQKWFISPKFWVGVSYHEFALQENPVSEFIYLKRRVGQLKTTTGRIYKCKKGNLLEIEFVADNGQTRTFNYMEEMWDESTEDKYIHQEVMKNIIEAQDEVVKNVLSSNMLNDPTETWCYTGETTPCFIMGNYYEVRLNSTNYLKRVMNEERQVILVDTRTDDWHKVEKSNDLKIDVDFEPTINIGESALEQLKNPSFADDVRKALGNPNVSDDDCYGMFHKPVDLTDCSKTVMAKFPWRSMNIRMSNLNNPPKEGLAIRELKSYNSVSKNELIKPTKERENIMKVTKEYVMNGRLASNYDDDFIIDVIAENNTKKDALVALGVESKSIEKQIADIKESNKSLVKILDERLKNSK